MRKKLGNSWGQNVLKKRGDLIDLGGQHSALQNSWRAGCQKRLPGTEPFSWPWSNFTPVSGRRKALGVIASGKTCVGVGNHKHVKGQRQFHQFYSPCWLIFLFVPTTVTSGSYFMLVLQQVFHLWHFSFILLLSFYSPDSFPPIMESRQMASQYDVHLASRQPRSLCLGPYWPGILQLDGEWCLVVLAWECGPGRDCKLSVWLRFLV